jgi:hypothetical protein
MIQVQSEWRESMDVEQLCAVVNDAQRMVGICEEIFGEEEGDGVTDSDGNSTEDLVAAWTQLSVLALQHLCELRFADLKEDHLGYVGRSEWESAGEDDPCIQPSIDALRDFHSDLQDWISGDYYHSKALKLCFDLTIQAYLESFLSNTMARGLSKPENAFEVVQRDWTRLVSFFCFELADHHGRGGFYHRQIMEDRLSLLEAVCNLLNRHHSPSKCKPDMLRICRQLGKQNGTPIILHLVGLRTKRRMSSVDSREWHVVISQVSEDLQIEDDKHAAPPAPPCYTLPDLRNSKFLHRVQPPRGRHAQGTDLTVDISETARLVQRQHLTKVLATSSKRLMMRSDRTLMATWKRNDDLIKTTTEWKATRTLFPLKDDDEEEQ